MDKSKNYYSQYKINNCHKKIFRFHLDAENIHEKKYQELQNYENFYKKAKENKLFLKENILLSKKKNSPSLNKTQILEKNKELVYQDIDHINQNGNLAQDSEINNKIILSSVEDDYDNTKSRNLKNNFKKIKIQHNKTLKGSRLINLRILDYINFNENNEISQGSSINKYKKIQKNLSINYSKNYNYENYFTSNEIKKDFSKISKKILDKKNKSINNHRKTETYFNN